MLKRTLVFQSPGYLSLALGQLCFTSKSGEKKSVPLEDTGFVIVESLQITISAALLNALSEYKIGVVFCNPSHMPSALLQPFAGHTLMQKVVAAQLSATEARKDRLWKQTVKAKIRNQAVCLQLCGQDGGRQLLRMADQVKNGDPENVEGGAARIYFKNHNLPENFVRDRMGIMPNGALNYGYAILRAAVARALVASGLLTVVGIHHHSQYDPYCLADDIMEPYRPFVDFLLFSPDSLSREAQDLTELTPELKQKLLTVLTADVIMGGRCIPVMSAISQTTASLSRCFLNEEKEIIYPEFPV